MVTNEKDEEFYLMSDDIDEARMMSITVTEEQERIYRRELIKEEYREDFLEHTDDGLVYDKKKAAEELNAIFDWADEQRDIVLQWLIAEGKHVDILNDHMEEFAWINKEMKKRIIKLQHKYGIYKKWD